MQKYKCRFLARFNDTNALVLKLAKHQLSNCFFPHNHSEWRISGIEMSDAFTSWKEELITAIFWYHLISQLVNASPKSYFIISLVLSVVRVKSNRIESDNPPIRSYFILYSISATFLIYDISTIAMGSNAPFCKENRCFNILNKDKSRVNTDKHTINR